MPATGHSRSIHLRRPLAAGLGVVLAGASLAALPVLSAPAQAASSALVISEVYGGGGNSGATLTHDFIELHNRSDAAVSLDGMSVQYRSSGNGGTGATVLSGSIAAGGHYLVQQAEGAGGTVALPTPDATGTLAMSGSNGIVFLAEGTSAITLPAGDAATVTGVVDLVGYGSATVFEGMPTAGLSNTTSAARTASADTDVNATDFTTGAPTPTSSTGGLDPDPDPQPAVEATIAEIQGTGEASTMVGQEVITQGVVTGVYPQRLFGFFMQTEGSGGSLDHGTHTASDGIFVYYPFGSGPVSVAEGDFVEVTGTVGEFESGTQLTIDAAADDVVELTGETPEPIAPASTWPTLAQRESLEGMLFRPQGPYTVTNTFVTNTEGVVGLGRGTEPLVQHTELEVPGSPEADALAAQNAADAIDLDDGSRTDFTQLEFDDLDDCLPGATLPCLTNGRLTPPYLDLDNPARVGSAVTFTDDVVFAHGETDNDPAYRFQPLTSVDGPASDGSPVTFEETRQDNLAPDDEQIDPDGEADLKVAAFNVLNYFTTLGVDDAGCSAFNDRNGSGNNVRGGCDQRGAWDPADLARQQAKIVRAIAGLDADVVGLMEIENSAALGETPDEATQTLVAALNELSGPGVWAANPSSADLPSPAGQDVITNAIIYQTAAVTRAGPARALGDQSETGEAFQNAREPIAQAFTPVTGGDPVLVVVNHLKSKGSPGPWPGDADTGDGQGSSVESRVRQAQALAAWVPGVQADLDVDDVLLVGDFNSYSMEDPMRVLYDAGYVNLAAASGNGEHSYSFGGRSGSLDHVLANGPAAEVVTGIDIWGINAGEALTFEYSRWNYHGTDFHQQNPFRSSDHDPLIVGLDLGAGGGPDPDPDPDPEPIATSVSATSGVLTEGRDATVDVDVAPATAGGTVTVRRDGQTIGTATLAGGSATVVIPGDALEPGTHTLTIQYAGDATHAPSTSTLRVTVVADPTSPDKLEPRFGVKHSPKVVRAGATRAKLRVTVRADGDRASGWVRVRVPGVDDGPVTKVVRLKNGKAKLRLPAFEVRGKKRIRITFNGSDEVAPGSTTHVIRVVPRRRR